MRTSTKRRFEVRKSLKISRGLQLLGAVLLVLGIVNCSQGGDPQSMSQSFISGLVLIVGARVYEWMSKE